MSVQTVGAKVRARRITLKLSQEELAIAVRKSRGWVSHIEAGRRRVMPGDIHDLAIALKLRPLTLAKILMGGEP